MTNANAQNSFDYTVYYRAGNWVADASPNTNFQDVVGIDAAQVINSCLANNQDFVSIKVKSTAGFTPSETITLVSNCYIELERYVTIDGSGKSFNVFTANNISNFSIKGGIVKSKASYSAVIVEGTSSDFDINIRAAGGGGGVYCTGTSNNGIVSCEGQNLGLAVSSGSPAGTDGVPVYLDEQTEKIHVGYSRNIDVSGSGVGTVDAWAAGLFSGSWHQIDSAFAENSAGGGVKIGSALASSHRTHDIQLGQCSMNLGNTNTLIIQNCYNVQFGQVNSYKAGAFSSAGIGEAGVSFYANYQNITGDQIISSYSQGEGILISISDAHDCSNVKINQIIAYDNYQGNSGTGQQAGLGITANNNGYSISDVTIDSVTVFDDQGTPTQLFGVQRSSISGSTLSNLRINHIKGFGNVTALRRTSNNGSMTGVQDFGYADLSDIESLVSQTATVANITTVTNDDAVATTYEVDAWLQISSFTSGTITVEASYTDTFNNARTLTLITGTTNAPYSSTRQMIKTKAGTAIKILTTGTFSATYDVIGEIRAVFSE